MKKVQRNETVSFLQEILKNWLIILKRNVVKKVVNVVSRTAEEGSIKEVCVKKSLS